MRIGQYAAVIGTRQQEKRLEVIANNLSNVGGVGYKKDNIHFADYVYQTSYTSMEQGPVKNTEQSLDLALQGKGFFKVQAEDGVLYTRSGDFSLNEQNVLVTQEGWPVLGAGGAITISGPDVRIEKDGQVFDKGEPGATEYEVVGKIEVVEFPDDVALEKTTGGYFKPKQSGVEPEPSSSTTLQQGALEGANFTAVEEMTRLIDTQRIFEAYEKVLQVFDQGDSQLISKLGAP